MSKEAMKQALEALEYGMAYNGWDDLVDRIRQHELKANAAITALRQALANEALDRKAENARELGLDYGTADEPVACGYDETTGNCTQVNCCYTHPQPAAQWVGLTDEEIDDLYLGAGKNDLRRAREIEQALKEKNT